MISDQYRADSLFCSHRVILVVGRAFNERANSLNVHSMASISLVCYTPVAFYILITSPLFVGRVGGHIVLSPSWGALVNQPAQCFSPRCVTRQIIYRVAIIYWLVFVVTLYDCPVGVRFLNRLAQCFRPRCVPLLRIVIPHHDVFLDF